MSETIRVIKVPKSKMQAIRQYTSLRGFVEIGDDGQPIGYYIEDDTSRSGQPPKMLNGKKPKRKYKGKRDPVPATARIQWVPDRYPEWRRTSKIYRVATAAMHLAAEPCRRENLKTTIAADLPYSERQVETSLAHLLTSGHMRAVEE